AVVLTSAAKVSAADQAAGLDAGADGYIIRPLDDDELLARVGAQLRQRELARSLASARDRLERSLAMLRIANRVARLGGWTIDLPGNHLTWTDDTCAIHDAPPGYQPTLDEGLSLFPEEWREEVRSKV